MPNGPKGRSILEDRVVGSSEPFNHASCRRPKNAAPDFFRNPSYHLQPLRHSTLQPASYFWYARAEFYIGWRSRKGIQKLQNQTQSAGHLAQMASLRKNARHSPTTAASSFRKKRLFFAGQPEYWVRSARRLQAASHLLPPLIGFVPQKASLSPPSPAFRCVKNALSSPVSRKALGSMRKKPSVGRNGGLMGTVACPYGIRRPWRSRHSSARR